MPKHSVYTRVDDETHRELTRIAKTEDRPISYIAARILRMSLPNSKPSAERNKT
jgi:predicted transcriptional regulator